MKQNYLFQIILIALFSFGNVFTIIAQTPSTYVDFQNATYYTASGNSLTSSGQTLAAFDYGTASPTHPLLNNGVYFQVVDYLGNNLWLRVKHIAADPNGTNVGWNVAATNNSPFSAGGFGGWTGFLYQFDIYNDINSTGSFGNTLNGAANSNVLVESIETLSQNEWLSLEIPNTNPNTFWKLSSINFTGVNPNSNPGFSSTLIPYGPGFSSTFPTNSKNLYSIHLGNSGQASEFRACANELSTFYYGYEYNISYGYQGIRLEVGIPPTFAACTSTSVIPTGIMTNTGSNLVCLGDQITLTEVGGSLGSGGHYKWYEGNCGVGVAIGTGTSITLTPTIGVHNYYVRIEDDCSYSNCVSISINVNTTPQNWYLDADGDHYYSSALNGHLVSCTYPGAGYTTVGILGGNDCDDNDAAVHDANQSWVLDVDGDHYYTSELIQCNQPTPAYIKRIGTYYSGDCDDNDPDAHDVNQHWVLDLDGDHYYTSELIQCNRPSPAYVQRIGTYYSGDCDDNNASINAGALEIAGNSIDENCNGLMDENNALHFDGTNDFVYIANSGLNSYSNELTISAWVKLDVGGINHQIINRPASYGFFIDNNSQLVYKDEGYFYHLSDGYGTVPTDRWVHVAVVVIGGVSTTFYINGNNVGVTTDFYSTHVSNNSLYATTIGGLNGTMDELCIWDVARTQTEIQSDFCGVTTPQTGLKLHYSFNQGIPNGNNSGVISVLDNSGNNINGTATNFAMFGSTSNWTTSFSFYEDLDGDGYGTTPVTCSLTASTVQGDCDDADANVHDANTVWYLDADGDHYYFGAPVTQCHSPGVGYTTTGLIAGNDCDDNDANAHFANEDWVLDADNDGYYVSDVVQCNSPGPGYHPYISQIYGDCDDNNATVHDAIAFWYLDADGDHFYTGSPITDCHSPGAGYTSTGILGGSDCNDNDNTVYPGAYEILGNLVDDNCNGQIDEELPCYPAFATFANSHNYCIANVAIGTIDNTTTCEPLQYFPYTNLSTILTQSTTYTIHIASEFYIDLPVSVYVDWNGNKVLNDVANELVIDNILVQPVSLGGTNVTFTVPISFVSGRVTMRVISGYPLYPISDPCSGYDGEAEDYSLVIECTPSTTNNCMTNWISNVQIGTINNTTTCSTNGYSDYSASQSTSAGPNDVVSYAISGDGSNNSGVSIYIDYNNDGDFDDVGEQVSFFDQTNSYDPLVASNSFTIPANQPFGSYRMRVISDDYAAGASIPCYSNSGEAEDYTLNVINNTPLNWYLDADGDGYYKGSPVSSVNSPGAGYVNTFTGSNDCDDNDNMAWQSALLYVDNDGDGYTSGTATVCYGATIPSGYSLTSSGSDCNDFDNSKWQTGVFYIDADGDGLTIGSGISICYGSSAPIGLAASSNGGDCDDNDPLNLILTGSPLPLLEGFEGANDPPTGWKNIDNQTQGYAWAKTAAAGGFGLSLHSMMFDDYNYNVLGEKDEIEVKRLDFTGISGASLTFDVAYKEYPNSPDELIVRVSIDCGGTFTNVYSKAGAVLSTAGIGSGIFTPTASEWRTETVDLSAFVGQQSVIIQFQNINHYGNKLYIDNVNVTGTASTCVQPTLPTINASSTTNCGTQSTTLSIATGNLNDATNWKWYSGSCNGTTVGTGTSINVSPSTTTTYFVRGEGGCVTPGSCASQTITVNPLLNWYIDADNDGSYTIVPIVACSSPGTGYFTASSPGSDCDDTRNYVHPGATEICGNGIDDNCNGQIDEGCCAINQSGIVTSPLCSGGSTGSINLTSSNISGTPSYIWSNGSTTEDLSNVTAGFYFVTVSYWPSCSQTNVFQITQPATNLIINITKTNIRCAGKRTGIITANPTGGTMPYTYNWSTGSIASSVTDLVAGNYTVTITDAIGCAKIKTITITTNPSIVILVTTVNGNMATASASGGFLFPDSSYKYNWNTMPLQTDATATGLQPNHTYKVKVTDSKNCTKITSISITPPRLINSNVVNTITVYPNPSTGMLTLTMSNCINCNSTFSIIDVLGNNVYSGEMKLENTSLIDIHHLAKGVYSLRITYHTDKTQQLFTEILKVVLE